MWNEDWYCLTRWGEEGGGHLRWTGRIKSPEHTWGPCILWQKLVFSWRGAATGLIRGPGLAARWSGDAPLLSDAVCAPLRILRPGISLSLVVYERWCLFLLACPRRRRATDFTHFYWLIWLFSCQQPRASQEPENPRDGGATATVAALWLWMPAGRIGGGGGGPLLSHNK